MFLESNIIRTNQLYTRCIGRIQSINECYRAIGLIPPKGRDVVRMLMCDQYEFPAVRHAQASGGDPAGGYPLHERQRFESHRRRRRPRRRRRCTAAATTHDGCRKTKHRDRVVQTGRGVRELSAGTPHGVRGPSSAVELAFSVGFARPIIIVGQQRCGFARRRGRETSGLRVPPYEPDLRGHLEADDGNVAEDRVEHDGSRPGARRSGHPSRFVA